MKWEVYNTATGEALTQTITRAAAWASIRRLNPASPLSVRRIKGA